MKIETETLDGHQVRLTITLDDETVNHAQREVARTLSKQLRIPGFRPGHAPLAAVIRAVGGEEAFNVELAEHLAAQVYPKALDEAKIDPYGPGKIIEFKTSPFQFIVQIPLEPTVDLKDYKSIRLPFPEVSVSDAEIEQQLELLREDNAIIQLVERPAQMGDQVEANVVCKYHESGQPALTISPDDPITLTAEGEMLPGLANLLVGMSAGERKEATLTLPEDFKEELRGATLDLSIEVLRVNSRMLPDISDELAQTVGNFTTLAELREDLRRRLVEFKRSQAEQAFLTQALDAFTALAEVRYPQAFVEDQLNKLLEEFAEDVEDSQGLPFDEWLKVRNKTKEEIREELRPLAELRGRRGLVMRALAQAEGLTVSEEEFNARIDDIVKDLRRNSSVKAALRAPDIRSTIMSNILSDKILQRMAQIAKGELEAASPEPIAG